jgi:hypothetical protein
VSGSSGGGDDHLETALLGARPQSVARSGVRWADMTRTSQAMSNASSVVTVWAMVSQSDFEPMTTPTNASAIVLRLVHA